MKRSLILINVVLLWGIGCTKGEQGVTGSRGVRGFQGDVGPKGAAGLQGEKGDAGGPGIQGEGGENGSSCSVFARDGGVIILCTDGTSSFVAHGQKGADGVDGNIGVDGENGNSCTTQETDGGISVSCTDGTSTYISHDKDGNDGNSCSTLNVDGGLKIFCTDETTSFVREGRDGINGVNGINGDDGSNGNDGISCSAQEVDGGAEVYCTNGTWSFLRHGVDGIDGQEGTNGAPGNDGDDCHIIPIDGGVTISCGEGASTTTETISHGSSCAVTQEGGGFSINCGEGSEATTASVAGFSSVEPFGRALINNTTGSLAPGQTLFSRFFATTTGVFDLFSIIQRDTSNVNLQVAIFGHGSPGVNWSLHRLVEGSTVQVVDTTTVDAFERFSGSGLNADLIKNGWYVFVIRNAGSVAWPYPSFYHFVTGSGTGGARLSWIKYTNDLSSYTGSTQIGLNDADGNAHKPWFRVSQ